MKKKVFALLMAGVMVVGLAACGSSASSTAAEAESAAEEVVEEAEEAVDEAESAVEEEVAEEVESVAEEVESEAEEAGAAEAAEGELVLEPAKAPENFKLAYIMGNASMSGGYVPGYAIQDIVDHFGWEYQTWDGEGDAGKENEAIMSALSWGADAIIVASVQAVNVQSALQAAAEKGIPCGSLSCGTDSPNEYVSGGEYNYSYDIGPYYTAMGAAFADYVKENTTGSGKVALWNFEGELSIDYEREGFLARLDELGVEYEMVGAFTFDQLGDTLNRTVSTYLTNNPDVEWVKFPFDPAAQPVSEFLDLNGVTDVKVLGVLGNAEMCDLIAGDSVAYATAAYDNYFMGFAAVDQMIRVLNGQDLVEPHGENVPFGIVDENNLPEGDAGWTGAEDYASKYFDLWS